MRKQLKINGETVAVSQQEPLLIEVFLNDNYLFRRNILNGKVEFKSLPEGDNSQWRPLTLEALNSIILKAERENVLDQGSPSAQIKMYVQSEEVPVFNPIAEFLNGSNTDWPSGLRKDYLRTSTAASSIAPVLSGPS